MRLWRFIVLAGAGCVDLASLGNGPPSDGGIPDANATDAANVGDSAGQTPDADAGPDGAANADGGDGGDPDLVAAWDFDGTGDVVPDITGHGYDGSLVGGATQEPGGIRGGALVLDGLELMRVDSLSNANFIASGTLSFWVRIDAPVTGPFQYVIDSHDEDRAHFFIRRLQDGGPFQAAFQAGDGAQQYAWIPATFNVPLATWKAVAITWSASDSKGGLYFDKKLIERPAYLKAFVPTQQLFVFGKDFVGRIDEVRLWKRVLSDAEIAALP